MLTIKLFDLERHRAETTFRPYLNARHLFREVGIRFISVGEDYDIAWASQASVSYKTISYRQSVTNAFTFLSKKIPTDCVIIDGQDSASLMGISDLADHPKVKLILKNTLYADKSNYQKPSPHGRIYWEYGPHDENIDWAALNPFDPDKIKLSGCNWLSTITPNWMNYKGVKKDFDVFALFSYPGKLNSEYQRSTNFLYDNHRKMCINQLKLLPKNVKVAMLPEDGTHIPIEQYYNLMTRSKIVIAPFGYGEIAPRDIESASVGAVLLKPDMSHIETIPNIYKPDSTYLACNWDFSNANDKILSTLENWDVLQEHFVENMRHEYATEYNPEKLVIHTHNWMSKLDDISIESN